MVTFDGAGGGSGYSPDKMMNEFGLPAACIESAIVPMCDRLKAEGKYIPSIVITGGFATEDQAYKALALGAPYVTAVGLCRATMAAAMVGKKVGDQLKEGTVPAHLQKFGSCADDLFLELGEVRGLYGEEAESMSLGAVGASSYLRKMTFGVQQRPDPPDAGRAHAAEGHLVRLVILCAISRPSGRLFYLQPL